MDAVAAARPQMRASAKRGATAGLRARAAADNMLNTQVENKWLQQPVTP